MPVDLAALLLLACAKCTFPCTQGSRVRPASGIPCALWIQGAELIFKTRANSCRENADGRHCNDTEMLLATALMRPQPLRADTFERRFGDDPVAAVLLGEIERAVAALDQSGDRLAVAELRHADRHGNARQRLAGRTAGDVALANRATDALGDRARRGEIRAGQHRNQFLATIARRQIDLAQAIPQNFRHQAQHLVADAMTELVVETLEMIDIEQERSEEHTSELQ